MTKTSTKKYFIDKEFIKGVGAKIRQIRISKEMTIETLAINSDASYSQVARMELGKVNFTISFLTKIAKALNVHPKELIP